MAKLARPSATPPLRGSGGLSPLRRGARLALLLWTASLGAHVSLAAATPARDSALLVFVAAGESQLAGFGDLSVGIMSATQGSYQTEQFLLDATQGARVASSVYDGRVPNLSPRREGTGGVVDAWRAARGRAEDAPQLLVPGLLAAQVAAARATRASAG